MATNPAETAQGAETELDQTDPNGAGNETGAEDAGDDNEPSPYDDLAQKIGWVPKDKFAGPPEMWKPAEQFILDGRDIQISNRNELKALRSTIDNISRTSASIAEQEVNRRVEELTGRYNQAVEEGDATKAFKISQDILSAKTPATPASPSVEASSFAERNKAWFKTTPEAPGDALATATAIDVCNRLASQGYDHATQLDAAEKEVKRQFPHLFGVGNNGKPAAAVNAPGNRSIAGGGNREKGFADLPLEAQRVANDMVSRGVIKADTPEAAKAMYAKNYWLNAKG